LTIDILSSLLYGIPTKPTLKETGQMSFKFSILALLLLTACMESVAVINLPDGDLVASYGSYLDIPDAGISLDGGGCATEEPELKCTTVKFSKNEYPEKATSALCLTIGSHAVSCCYRRHIDVTECKASSFGAYSVTWYNTPKGTSYGEVQRDSENTSMALVYQAADNSFRFVTLEGTEVIRCSIDGNVATVCVH
jgi:hypothetical protein